MRLRIASSFVTLLAALAFGRVTNKGDDASDSIRPLESSLNYSIVPIESPASQPVTEPNDINPASGAIFDPNVWAGRVLWETFVQKGHQLICLMQASDQGAGWLMQDTRQPPSAASRWTGNLASELRLWYWREDDIGQGLDCDFREEDLGDVFIGLGLHPGPKFNEEDEPADGENECRSIDHGDRHLAFPDDLDIEGTPIRDQYYVVNGKEYRATGGSYTFAVNYNDGVIIAKNILSPRMAVQKSYNWGRPAQPGELPELQSLSDIYWAYWVHDNPNVKNFRVYGAQNVINDRTVLLVTRALRNRGKFAPEIWPGITFEQGTEEFQALIASPIGATACYFLIGHKAELGIKQITKVIIVCDGNDQEQCTRIHRGMHMFFIIEDVPRGQVAKREGKEAVGEMSQVETHILREHKVMANL